MVVRGTVGGRDTAKERLVRMIMTAAIRFRVSTVYVLEASGYT